MAQGERVEIKRRKDGDFEWFRIAPNNEQRFRKGEGLVNEGYAWADALEHNPDVPVLLMDEQGGIIEERRRQSPESVPSTGYSVGDTITGPEGMRLTIIEIHPVGPKHERRFRMELVAADEDEKDEATS